MTTFANPQYFYLLLLLPVVAGLFYLTRRKRQAMLARYGKASSLRALMPNVSPYKPWIKLGIELALLLCIITMLARPLAGGRHATTKVHGIEVMVAVDVSNSMNASSTDNPQDVSRLQRAKFIVEKLIDRFDNDKVGLLVFAGNAYMQMPLTADIGAAKLFLNDINTSMAPTQGTAIGAAINLARQAFSQNKKSRKTIIVITDGENFEDDAVQAAAEAQKAGITVNVMGVGSTHGAPIPMPDGGYMTDDEGQPVTTYLNEDMAQKIAQAGKGTYVNGSAANAIDTLRDTLDTLAKTDLDTIDYSQQDELFPWLAALALLLVFAWVALLERKNPWLQKFNFFSRNTKQ